MADAAEARTRLSTEGADAIVVLGCQLFPGGRPSERLRRRVALGVELYREGAAPLIVMSGGGAGTVSEATVMRDLARKDGVPETALLLETESRNTFENAGYTARLLRESGKMRIVLVSDRAHLPRAARMFRRAGIDVIDVAGVPASSMRRAFGAVLYEAASHIRGLFRRRVKT
ncbi:MAG: YdcF family protein [Alphaproteobacteria bacterium]|nr:YdcF family protein [Alphaproteobacteria bacterium]